MEFIDIISITSNQFVKRYYVRKGGKKEVVEESCSRSDYFNYLDSQTKKQQKTFISCSPLPVVGQLQKDVNDFNFNQQSNFLYHFVNKFVDTEVPIEAIREELKNML